LFHVAIDVHLQVRRKDGPFRTYTWPPQEEYHFTARPSHVLICYTKASTGRPATWPHPCEEVLDRFFVDLSGVRSWFDYCQRFCENMNRKNPPRSKDIAPPAMWAR
jgi:hypothetical protein